MSSGFPVTAERVAIVRAAIGEGRAAAAAEAGDPDGAGKLLPAHLERSTEKQNAVHGD